MDCGEVIVFVVFGGLDIVERVGVLIRVLIGIKVIWCGLLDVNFCVFDWIVVSIVYGVFSK